MKNLTVQIEEDQHEWLKRKAFEEDKSMASIIRMLIDDLREKSEIKEGENN